MTDSILDEFTDDPRPREKHVSSARAKQDRRFGELIHGMGTGKRGWRKSLNAYRAGQTRLRKRMASQ